MLDGLVERAGVPDRHHERLVLGARPADRLAFQHLDRELDVHRHLDPGADDLAVALERVAVADVQEAALGEDREVDDDALAEAAIVHVAAVRDVVPVPVVAAGVDRPGADDVAARDPEDRLVRADRRLEVSRLELVDHLASTSSRSLSPRPERFSSTSCSSSSATRANAWA